MATKIAPVKKSKKNTSNGRAISLFLPFIFLFPQTAFFELVRILTIQNSTLLIPIPFESMNYYILFVFLIIILQSIIYFMFGYKIFNKTLYIARKRGDLGSWA